MPTALTVHATLTTPTVGIVWPLDEALAQGFYREWARRKSGPRTEIGYRFEDVELDPMDPEWADKLDLPLEKWEQRGQWGWKSSRALGDVQMHSLIEKRDGDGTEIATWWSDLHWHVECRDGQRERLELLLDLAQWVGDRGRDGYGRVAEWRVEDGAPDDGWHERLLPVAEDDRVGAVWARPRAPYGAEEGRVLSRAAGLTA